MAWVGHAGKNLIDWLSRRLVVTQSISLMRQTRRATLVIPDLAEPIVYSARAVKVCGLVSAFTISENIEFGAGHAYRGIAGQLVLRELDKFKIIGEVQVPDYFLSILAVIEASEYKIATSMLLSWVCDIARANQVDSPSPLPDPYHSVEDIMLNRLSPEGTVLPNENFAGSAYTVHIGVRWAARRLWRQTLNSTWANVSRIQHHSFSIEGPVDYLVPLNSRGTLTSWFYPTPKSWSELRSEAEQYDVSALPATLLRCPEFVPFYCLALPHRFNGPVSDLLDQLASEARRNDHLL